MRQTNKDLVPLWLPALLLPCKLCPQIVYLPSLFPSPDLSVFPDFTFSLPVWSPVLPSNTSKELSLPCCRLSLFLFLLNVLLCSFCELTPNFFFLPSTWIHPYTFISVTYFFHEYFSPAWSSASCITHISQPDCHPVWHWQLKIVLIRLQHPTVHSGCQVPCCHGNYAELSGCPVDIYRVEKDNFESRPSDRAWLSFMVVPFNSEGWVGLM